MASSASSRSIAAIVGVGPDLGRSVARKFAHEGYTVAILARDPGKHPQLSLSRIFFVCRAGRVHAARSRFIPFSPLSLNLGRSRCVHKR